MTQPPTNADVAAALRRLADLLEISGEAVFRVNAYRRAADSIVGLSESVAAIRARGDLRTIPGVGEAIAAKIDDMVETGRIRQLDALEREIPSGVADLLNVPEIGPKRAALLYRELGVDSLEALRAALESGKVAGLPGLGPKAAERIAIGLSTMVTDDQRMPLPVASRLGGELVAWLLANGPGVTRASLAGSARRCRETVGDLDLVAAAPDPAAVVEAFAAMPGVARVEMRGANRCRVWLERGVAADLRVLPEEHWGSLLFHFTGSKAHAVHVRDLTLDRGAHLSEYGFEIEGRVVPSATEEEVYAFLGMRYIPPPMREDTGEIELALRGEVPRVVERREIRGDLHVHSTWSDGAAPIREMALAAIERGYEYLAITDHSVGLGIARGLSAARLAEQRHEIDQINAELAPFRLLQGVEVNVKADGTLDLPDEVLARLDLVIASVHTGLRDDRAKLTARAVAALRHPLVTILAHPTGRVLGMRPGGDYDLDTLVAEAAATGTVLEINGAVLDLRDSHARQAIASGCVLALDSDAHAAAGLDDLDFAVGVAQRAWVPPESVLNTRPLAELIDFIHARRR